jgi:excisionase family DNA binding protein
MKTQPATDQWVTIEVATKALGRSERSIQRLVQQGALSQRREGVNGQAERLYSASDLARIKEQGITTMTALVPVKGGLGRDIPIPARALANLALPPPPEPAPAANALWLSLEQAAEVSGLSESFLRGLIDTEAIAAVKGGPHGAWRIRRASLEEYAG